MKKAFSPVHIALAAGTMTVLATMTAWAAQLTKDGAKSLALEHAGLKAEDVTFAETDMDMEDNQLTYEIKFVTKDYQTYNYEILAADGTIWSIKYEAGPSSLPQKNKKTSVTSERAKEIALSHAGRKAEDVTFVKTETEYDDGRLEYELEFVTADKKEYEYEISGSTGAVISFEYDAANSLIHTESTGTGQAYPISGVNSAKEAALKQAGLKPGDVVWGAVKADYDDGRLVYEGNFYHGTLEYEFEIDAASAALTEWDVDSIYD